MKAVIKLSVVLLLASVLQAQTATPKKKVSKPKPVNADVQALKDAVAAQQEQILALSAHLIAQTPPKPKARPKAKAATFADVQAECSAPVELAQIQDRLFTL